MDVSDVMKYFKNPYSPVGLDKDNDDCTQPPKKRRCPHVANRACAVYTLVITVLMVIVCVREFTSEPPICFNEWKDYQLGDAIREWKYRPNWYPKYKERYPHSLATQFMEKYHAKTKMVEIANDVGPLSTEEEAYLAKIARRYNSPQDDTLVIHLRLGDVMNQIDDVAQFWSGRNISHGEYPFAFSRTYYEQIGLPDAISSVVIVGSSTHRSEFVSGSEIAAYDKSMQYLECFRTWFGARYPNAEVWWRGNYNTPDSDFAYLCAAKSLVSGGGGFGYLAEKTVLFNGGTVYANKTLYNYENRYTN